MTPREAHVLEQTGPARIGDWSIDSVLDEITRNGETIKLEPRMMRLLCRLAEQPEQVVSSQQLLDSVWPGVIVGPASVYQAVSALRKILGDTGATPTYIATVARKGYRLIAAVQRPHPAPLQMTGSGHDPVRKPRRKVVVLGLTGAAIAAVVIATVIGLRQEAPVVMQPAQTAKLAPLAWPPTDLPTLVVLPLRAAAPGARSAAFASVATDLLANRLAKQKDLVLVSTASVPALADRSIDVRDLGRRMHASYVVRGEVSHVDDLKVYLALIDTANGNELWNKQFTSSATGLTALREEIVRDLGARLNVRIGKVGNTPVDLAAYELLMRGQTEYLKLTQEGFSAAHDIFLRTTMLYPDFARAYFGLSFALRQLAYKSEPRDPVSARRLEERARNALDRALDLDPDLGEAIIDLAEFIDDPVEAERMFRRGLEQMPSYALGALKFGNFLSQRGRTGEGLAAYEYGLRVDPLSPPLMIAKANILALVRGDVAGHEAVLRELLANHPETREAAISLAWSNYYWGGKTAEALAVFERESAREPSAAFPRQALVSTYLDVDDPEAAAAVAKDLTMARLLVAQYRGRPIPATTLPDNFRTWKWLGWSADSISPECEAIRDRAIATGDFDAALVEFAKLHPDGDSPSAATGVSDLVHAHVLLLSGDEERGRALVNAVLRMFDAEEVGRPTHWFARNRATAYALLGDDDRALVELAESLQRNDLIHWWYTEEHDPVFAHLREDPRFLRLAALARRHRTQQRELLDEMRRKGDVPKRP